MAFAQWPLLDDRPVIQIVLTLAQGGPKVTRTLLADTGAGARRDPFQLILDEVDCVLCGGKVSKMITLGGSFVGTYPIYGLPVEIPQLNFRRFLPVVGVANIPKGFEGIAAFRFLNRFTYGNFGDRATFGLET
jgi:hypothetical protein